MRLYFENKKRMNESLRGVNKVTACSFDFAHVGDLDEDAFKRALEELLDKFNAELASWVELVNVTD